MKRFIFVAVFIPALCLVQKEAKTIEGKTVPGAIQISLEEPSMMMTAAFEDKNGMVFVPGGFFDMGSNDSVASRSGMSVPVHTVWVDGFWMDKTEVTNNNYCEFLNAWGKTTDASGNEMINPS
ncbi:MAG: SUMF1/EgtB/PvdO family nonheme iron enzyme [Candidatus Aminicenantes bacterium]|nr:SUMF1/EgtB/PvdO family nonheme iron enzyme [Candidatus Aminicenantes bacterium]